jgi:hypothetical protein
VFTSGQLILHVPLIFASIKTDGDFTYKPWLKGCQNLTVNKRVQTLGRQQCYKYFTFGIARAE